MDHNETTRQFPRTASEAFKRDEGWHCSLERPAKPAPFPWGWAFFFWLLLAAMFIW